MDELERALRAVLEDPAQLQELRTLADSLGLSAPQPHAADAASTAPPPMPEPPGAPPLAVPEAAAAMLRQRGGASSKQEALLLALKPFLRKQRQEKIDRALHAARLASLASLALKSRGSSSGTKETL